MAAEHAADAVFDPRSVDVVAETRKVTHDEGADFVFDCAGIQASLDLAIHAVRPRGTIMNIALWGEKAHIDFMEVLMKEIFITGT